MALLATPPQPGTTQGQAIPETDPAYLLFAAGQGYRADEARAYTALRQNAIHQAYQDQLPGLILAGQQKALSTEKTFADAGAWRTGARIQQQGRDAAELQNQITEKNNAQQQQQNDLQAQLNSHLLNLGLDTSQAGLQARENAALTTAALGGQAYVHPLTQTAQIPPTLVGPSPYATALSQALQGATQQPDQNQSPSNNQGAGLSRSTSRQ